MAGESAHLRLRDRPSTLAVRAFGLPPRMQPMLDRAKTGLAEPFRGIITDGGIVPGLFAIAKTGVSLVPLVEVARSDRKSTRLNSSHVRISYAVFCLKKK